MRNTCRFQYFISDIQNSPEKEVEINPSHVREFLIIESLENLFLTAELEIADNAAFFSSMPLTGEETIKIVMTQEILPSKDGDKEADITKVVEFKIFNIQLIDSSISSKVYRFYLAEKCAFDFLVTNTSLSYHQKLVSEIMTDISINQLKLTTEEFDYEKTDEKMDFIIPFWNPLQTIKHLQKKARREKNPKEAGFVFYSTIGSRDALRPMKRFVSLATLIEAKTPTDDKDKYYLNRADVNPFFINNIKEMSQSSFCKRSILKDGIGGKRYFGFTPSIDKNLVEITKVYSDWFKKAATTAKVSYLKAEIDGINGDIGFYGGTANMIEARQDSSFRYLLTSYSKREVIVEGFLDRYAGQVIWINQSSENPEEPYQKQDTGKWLVKTITHHYSGGEFTQKMIIVKDSFTETDAEGFITKDV